MSSKKQLSQDVLRRNEKEWSAKILRTDIEELRRERIHLRSKSYERPLTDWECQRISEISQEIIQLLKRFLNFGMHTAK